jgi:serine/threonine protein kinase/tetratricopeptide (TPR) repeat protein
MLDQTISHYRITQKLGAGGMGVVYKAMDLTLERTVALKFLPTEFALSEAEKDQLVREARAASALDHANIGVIHGMEESEDGQLFIVMAYYEGETLSQKINRGVVSVRDSLDYAMQIAKGLGAAHARNIVHRDVKPSNIIITMDNTAKIVDFGLARVVATTSATQSVSNTGTLPYMAPEQILGEPVDQRADVWALGVLMVQMLTGSHPFLRPNTAAMTFAILNQPPSAVDAVPAPVQPIVYRALSKQASHRYANATEMVQDLEAARAQITATPLPLDEPTVTRTVSSRELKQFVQNASTPRWATPQGKVLRRTLLGVLAFGLIFLASLFVPSVREHLAGLVYAYAGEKHIAVVRFGELESDGASQAEADGFVDSLTNRLSNLQAAQQSLWVVPASMVRSHKIADPGAAFRELGATLVVETHLQRSGPIVSLTINLIDAKHLRQIGSTRLEDRAGDFGALEDRAVSYLAQAMRVKTSDESFDSVSNIVPSSYEAYIKALGYLQRFDRPGNIDLAISTILSATQTDPGFARGYAILGSAYRLKYQTDHRPDWLQLAVESCEKAILKDPRIGSAHVTLGHVQATLGKNDQALMEFQKALDINPRDSDAIHGLAEVQENLGQASEAEASYKRAIAIRPDFWDGYNSLAAYYYDQHRHQDAIGQFKRVIELTPDNSAAYQNLGTVYSELDDPQSQAAAEAAFRKSIALAPNYAAYASLGLLYSDQKRYPDAAAMLKKALELNDKDWRVWSYLTETYKWAGDHDNAAQARSKAIVLLEHYVTLNANDGLAQSALGRYYSEENSSEKALAQAKAALKLAPKDPIVLANVSETYEALGNRKAALQYAHETLKNGSTLANLQTRYGLQNLVTDKSFRESEKQ